MINNFFNQNNICIFILEIKQNTNIMKTLKLTIREIRTILFETNLHLLIWG